MIKTQLRNKAIRLSNQEKAKKLLQILEMLKEINSIAKNPMKKKEKEAENLIKSRMLEVLSQINQVEGDRMSPRTKMR